MKSLVLISLCAFALGACSHHGKMKDHHHKKSHHHKMWKKMDADGNNEVTRAEFDKAHGEMFEKMDANNDGKVTKEEKMAFMKSKMEGKKDKECCK